VMADQVSAEVNERLLALSKKLELLENEATRFKRNCDILQSLQADTTEISEIWKQFTQNTPLLTAIGQIAGRDVKLPQ